MRSVHLIALALALAACSSPVPSGSVLPSGNAIGSGTPAALTPPPGAASPAPPSPPATSLTPAPPTTGNTPDSVFAKSTAVTYLGHLVAGRYTRAWQLLSVQSQQQVGSLAAFTAERSAFFASAGTRFTTLRPNNSEVALAQWLPQSFDGQRDHAYVVTVTYPKLAGNNAGTAVLVAAPNGNDDWRIWVVR